MKAWTWVAWNARLCACLCLLHTTFVCTDTCIGQGTSIEASAAHYLCVHRTHALDKDKAQALKVDDHLSGSASR